MASHDVICMSEFVLFNNKIIVLLLFGKTAKLLLSIMMWVEETKHSYKFVQRQNVMLDEYGVNFVIGLITDIWLVSLDCLNTLIMMKSETDNEQVEEMLRMSCHTAIKALVKFTHITLRHDGTFINLLETLYNFSDFFQSAFKQYMVMNKQHAFRPGSM